MSSTSQAQIERTLGVMRGKGFFFGQGAVVQAAMPGQMSHHAEQASAENFATGRYHDGLSHSSIDLGVLHRATTPLVDGAELPVVDGPLIDVWFAPKRLALDISAILGQSDVDDAGIPVEMAVGPISSRRSGAPAAGFSALLTRMCLGRLVLDPGAFVGLISEVDPADLVEVEDDAYAPLRVFNATLSMDYWLNAFGLDPMSLVSQLAALGLGAVGPIGEHFLNYLVEHLPKTTVGLAWFIDEQDRVHTSQMVINLTNVLADMLRGFDPAGLAEAGEQAPTNTEWLEHIDSSVANGQLGFVNAMWQIFDFDADVAAKEEPIEWPDAADLTERLAAQVTQEAQGTAD